MNSSHTSFRQYLNYVAIALVAFISTIAFREVVHSLLPADTPGYYLVSMATAYCIGIVINFILQYRYTFSSVSATWGMFRAFVIVAIIGAAITLLTSLLFRYLLFDKFFTRLSPTLGFIAGNVVASVSTYILNASYVFRRNK